MKTIPLTQGKVALVDDSDYAELARYKWCAHKQRHTWYAMRNTPRVAGRSTMVMMHRQIMGAAAGQEVDHRDGDGLNCQRYNLRYCTNGENQHNQHHKRSGCTSRYKGVSRAKKGGMWQAKIVVNSKKIWLGYFDCEEDAARAYNAAAVEHFGEFACLNEIKEMRE